MRLLQLFNLKNQWDKLGPEDLGSFSQRLSRRVAPLLLSVAAVAGQSSLTTLELWALIHPRIPGCSTDESLGGCWFKGCLAEFTGTQGDGGCSPRVCRKSPGLATAQSLFFCFFKAARAVLGFGELEMPRSSCCSHPQSPGWHSHPLPPCCSDLPPPSTSGAAGRAGAAPGMWFYPARGEGLGQAREAEQISCARHLLPASAEVPAAAFERGASPA